MNYNLSNFNIIGEVISDIERFLKISKTHEAFMCTETKHGTIMVMVSRAFHNGQYRNVYIEFSGDGIATINGLGDNDIVIARTNFNSSMYDEEDLHLSFIYLLDTFGVYTDSIKALIESETGFIVNSGIAETEHPSGGGMLQLPRLVSSADTCCTYGISADQTG